MWSFKSISGRPPERVEQGRRERSKRSDVSCCSPVWSWKVASPRDHLPIGSRQWKMVSWVEAPLRESKSGLAPYWPYICWQTKRQFRATNQKPLEALHTAQRPFVSLRGCWIWLALRQPRLGLLFWLSNTQDQNRDSKHCFFKDRNVSKTTSEEHRWRPLRLLLPVCLLRLYS